MAASTRRRFIATMRRSHPFWKSSCAAKPATFWRSAPAPASTRSRLPSRLPSITWWPTDLNDNHLRSIAAWRSHTQARQREGAGPPRRQRGRLAARRARPAVAVHGDLLRQRHPHLAVGAWRKACSPAPAAICAPAAGCSSTARSSATASTPRRATPRSTKACAAGIRNGACATPPTLRRSSRDERTGFVLASFVEMPSNNAILTFEQSWSAERRVSSLNPA